MLKVETMPSALQVLRARGTRRAAGAFARHVFQGLSRSPKSLSSMYFYDAEGSRLFQRITELEEYYLTRCEAEIIETHAPEIAAAIVAAIPAGPFRLVELGAGDGQKSEILVRRLLDAGLCFEYAPIDICRKSVIDLAASFRRRFNGSLQVRGVVAEYFNGLASLGWAGRRPNFVLFLGSSVGNFSHAGALRFFRRLRESLRPGDFVLVGFDLKKDPEILHRAYNDSEGVTRLFNLNLLERINRELGGEFDRGRFAHYGAYNIRKACMESWLVSLENQEVPIHALGRSFSFRAWEGIHVERSHKYDLSQIESFASAAGFRVQQHLFDRRRWFVDSLWQRV
jgi:L-histidine N-alpha-methyltransferase